MSTEQEFTNLKISIDELVANAQNTIMPKVTPILNVIEDIKRQLVHGTDTIPTVQLHEWGLVLSVANTELTPQKDAYALASSLWNIEIKKSNATNLAQRRQEQRKVDIENQNVIDSSDKETQKAILDYMAALLEDTQRNATQLLYELNRIMDARTALGEAK